MKFKVQHLAIAASAAAVVMASAAGHAADQRYTLGSLSEGTTPFLVNTAWANAVNKYVKGHKIQVSAVGAATRHAFLVSEGKMDFTMWAPVQYNLMFRHIGPYKKLKDGPKRTEKISSLFSYKIGVYHPIAYASSGIKSFADIKGKKVFLGPPAGVATRNTRLIVEAMTGYKPGEDYQQIKLGWGPAQQSFQDKKFDVWITTTSAPSPAISQLALTNKLRLLSLDKSKFNHPSWKKYIRQPGRTIETINPRVYGDNMVNTEPVLATGAWVGMAVRSDMDEELVYQMMKAFWENIGEAHAMAKSMKETLTLQNAVEALSGVPHPGALRYYKEKGIEIKKPFKLSIADLKKKK